ncbi:Hypothetical protein R9X50_00073600 [Acrodontium crateriforme]|uniref:F-box domain-containing protein n=1 Tax=Acrodontium crateriforme TaxID=150365 RepID=A0AAQ3LY45_9PEZI|nr:Hypothetical protein R9X50_00073600 [Acrodontium crateriforme]
MKADAVSSDSWRRSKRKTQMAAVRTVLADNQTMTLALRTLSSVTEDLSNRATKRIEPDLLRRLDEAKASIEASAAGFNHYLSLSIATRFFNERHSLETPDMVHRHALWEVRDVVEMILLKLPVDKLLETRLVCKSLRDVIASSTALQMKLHLKPDPKSLLELPFSVSSVREKHRTLKFSCDEDHGQVYHPPTYQPVRPSSRHLALYACVYRDISQIGDMYKSMLVCQPPIYELGAAPLCCRSITASINLPTGYIDVPARPSTKIAAATGLTVGHLIAAAQEIQKEHAHCPFAEEHMHTSDGIVHPQVQFFGWVELREDDPALQSLGLEIPADEALNFPAGNFDTSTSTSDVMRRYIAAKRAALTTGRTVPTYSDFLAGEDPVPSEAETDE